MAPSTETWPFAWSRWRKLTGVLYDRKIRLRLKAKVYEAIIRPALTYGSECWATNVTNKRKIATTEMRILRGILEICRDEITCETRKSDAYYTFHRSTSLCAVAVFVGLDMSRDEMQTTSPAERWSWQYNVPDDEDVTIRNGTNRSRTA